MTTPSPLRDTPSAIGPLLRGARAQCLALLGLMVLAGLTDGIGILLLVPLLGLLDSGGGPSHNAWVQALQSALHSVGWTGSPGGLLVAFVVLIGLRSLVQYAREEVSFRLHNHLVTEIRAHCFARLLGVEWRWLVGTRQTDHANLLLTDVNRIGVGLNAFLGLLATGFSLGVYLLVACVLSWPLTLMAVLCGALVFALLGRQRRQAIQLGQRLTQAQRALHGNVQETLAGIKLAKILGSETRQLNRFRHSARHLQAQQFAFSQGSSLSRALFQVGGAALLALYLYAGLQVWHTPVPELLTLVLVFSRLIPLAMTGHQQLHQGLHALPALQQADALMGACRAHAEPTSTGVGAAEDETGVHGTAARIGDPDSRQEGADAGTAVGAVEAVGAATAIGVGVGARTLISATRSIELQAVSVHHADREHPALHRVTLRFPARTTTAIMGASGAGKSTLADVLTGLLAPDTGQLRVDGEPIIGPARHAWRQQVSYVPQEPFLFHDSLRHNLQWGQPQATEADMRMALQRASAADFVARLPQGLDTVVGDGGVRLSGGERQRIALARALLRRPSLLILDEATSALDTENEARIRQAIEQLHGDLTVVIIGHRLPTLEHADQVVVLDAGRVIAQGNWDEVRRQRGTAPAPAATRSSDAACVGDCSS